MKTGLPAMVEPGQGDGTLCGVVINFDKKFKATKIERINLSKLNNFKI